MSDFALQLSHVTKHYKDFTLNRLSFTVPRGSIVGLIGENGAGKSTTINAILGLTRFDEGSIRIFDKAANEADRNDLGVVFDGNSLPDTLTPRQLGRVFAGLYSRWDEQVYRDLLKRFSLPSDKKIKALSKGMKMKYAIAVALSHDARLLILDEATSGLDPIVRDEILDLFLDFIQDEDHAILVSSHITTDLEKVADYLVFLHEGNTVFAQAKDQLMESYGLLKCGPAQLETIDPEDILRCRRNEYECQVLVTDRARIARKYPQLIVDPVSIDEIMLMYIKGEAK